MAVLGEASSATSVATSSGVVKRPVGMPATARSRTASALAPVALPIVAATPWSPSQRSVATGPGETLVSDLEEAVCPEFHAADVVDEDVDLAVPVDGLAHQPLGAAGLDQVDLDRRDVVEAGQAVDRERARDDVRALGRQQPHHRQADPFAGAGDDSHFLVQLEVHRLAL